MKKILTIDFDIIMNPSIDWYNDSELEVDEFLNRFDFMPVLTADLNLYRDLTEIVLKYIDNITFIYNHHDIVDFLKNEEEPFELYNIDYHHDIGYGEDNEWHIPLSEDDYHEGNWVRYLYNINKIQKYIWYKSYYSSSPDEEIEKYLSEEHLIHNVNMDLFTKEIEFDRIYICLSPEWVPEYYRTLYYLWEDLTKIK